MNMTLETIKALTIAELTEMSAAELLHLQHFTHESYGQAQRAKDWIDGAIALKYGDRDQQLRQQLGKDTGVIHFEDDGVKVTVNLPKKPKWDQKQLAAVATRMWSQGQDPTELIDISYRISERKYCNWPEPLKMDFASARTLGTGKAIFYLSSDNEETYA